MSYRWSGAKNRHRRLPSYRVTTQQRKKAFALVRSGVPPAGRVPVFALVHEARVRRRPLA